MALTTRKGARANGPVTVSSGVTAVGSCRTVVVSRREVVRVVVERRRHVTAAELNCRVVMVRGARIKVTVVTARDNARGVVKIVGTRTLTGAAVRRTVIDVTLSAVKVRTRITDRGTRPRTVDR